MGLDVTAVSGAVFMRKRKNSDDDGWEENLHWAYPWDDEKLAPRMDKLKEGLYAVRKEDGFRAGSYSGYNWWRSHLSLMSNDVPPHVMWDDPDDEWVGKPFYELIAFSDCEGTIGPQTCAKLYADFRKYRRRAGKYADELEDGEWWLEKYVAWQAAFRMGAERGFVKLH